MPVVRAKRLVSRNNRPGLVKIAFKSLDDKKKILIEKKKLRQTDHFRNKYIHSSKYHVERIQEINTHIILQEIHNGNKYCITANGHLVPNHYGQERERRDFGLGPGMVGPHGHPQQQWQQHLHPRMMADNTTPQQMMGTAPLHMDSPWTIKLQGNQYVIICR